MPARVSTLPPALLLAATGGLLDAVVFLSHGHVFANAMTGNVVLLAISAATGNWGQATAYLVPILAFLLGVFASHLLQNIPSCAILALALESVVLAAVAFLPPSFPRVPFVSIIAFVSAFQVTTFRRIGDFSYNSTFTTGNLRDTAEGLFLSLTRSDPALRLAGRRRFRSLGLVSLSFFLGALLGALAVSHLANHAFLLAEPLLLAVLALILFPTPSKSEPVP